MSFDFTSYSTELESALNYASQSALICATSAGNDGKNEIVYPAALQSVAMGVASTSNSDMRSSFSNYGNAHRLGRRPGRKHCHHVSIQQLRRWLGNVVQARPFVSGTSALLLSKQANTNESQAAAAVAHAVPVGSDMGNGRLDAVLALGAISPADFSLSSNPTTSTINAGQLATYALAVTPTNGFNQTVALSCSGFPQASTCVITPLVATPDGTNPATATITVANDGACGSCPPLLPCGSIHFRGMCSLALFGCWGGSPGCWFGRLGVVWAKLHASGLTWPLQSDSSPFSLLLLLLQWHHIRGRPSGPATLSSLTLNSTSVNGGSPSPGSVTLSAPAPSGGALVSLSSSKHGCRHGFPPV